MNNADKYDLTDVKKTSFMNLGCNNELIKRLELINQYAERSVLTSCTYVVLCII